ncbi:Ethylene-responsive transcription factor-like protein [Acorus calamus]|uniref:Ethylene-responsive transcription factor-like protein n=1 Tax=Acorus calamus TaxID=4465 RepID=A0AAV9D2P2_ACOCL|nr:Ethylene-responsive transcription factor-like protein [Acorus calamus]
MVSIRRRKLLGLCSGKGSFSVELPKCSENGDIVDKTIQNKSVSVHPMPSVECSQEKQLNILEPNPGSSTVSASSSPGEEPTQQSFGREIKRRKRHRRKNAENQEPAMRGVYYKNSKWQAAIKVDKKQIHLGTVGSQEEAAHLYDRAAFMCGREPNFELPEEEKRELSQFNWDDFLNITRSAITSKKHQRRAVVGEREGVVGTSSASDDVDRGASVY